MTTHDDDRDGLSDLEMAVLHSEATRPLSESSELQGELVDDEEWIAALVRQRIIDDDLVRVRPWSQPLPYGSTYALERRADFSLREASISLDLSLTPVESIPLTLEVAVDLDEWRVKIRVREPRVEGAKVVYRVELAE